MKKQFKALLFDYDEIVAVESLDEHVVCLDDREVRLLLAMLEYARWQTRWYGNDMSKDAIEAFVDGIAGKLSTGCAMELVLEDCGLYLRVGGTDVSAVDLTECVDFYSLQLNDCELVLYEGGTPQDTIDIQQLKDCFTDVPTLDNCDASRAMAMYIQQDITSYYQYDLLNGPYSSKHAFTFTFRDAFPTSIFGLMPAGNALAIASAWGVPNELTADILASAGAQDKLANIIFCALEARDAGGLVTNLRLLIQQYMAELEFWTGEIFDVMWHFINNLPYQHFDYYILKGAAEEIDGYCTGYEPCEDVPFEPANLYICSDAGEALEHLGDNHWRINFTWYDTSVPDTAMHACIGCLTLGSNQCFIVRNLTVTVGPTPNGVPSHIVSDCTGALTFLTDFFDTQDIPVWSVQWRHTFNTSIQIEFDVELV